MLNFLDSTDNTTKKVDLLWHYSIVLSRSVNLMRLLGYGLLAFTLFDVIAAFVPLNFTNPIWEFGLLRQLVEGVAAPLIGFVLVFMAEREGRHSLELGIVKILSSLTLIIAFLFLFLTPLGVSSTIRIDQQNKQQLTLQVDQTRKQIRQELEQVDKITTLEEVKAFWNQPSRQGRAPIYQDIKDIKDLDDVKEQIKSSLVQNDRQLKVQAASAQSTQRNILLKNSIKWNVGALLSAALFFSLWRCTAWARRSI